MTQGILTVLGGVGLFLFGMKIMTEALQEVAGTRLRRLLARFTTTPLAGVATGAAATALVQSSSATTVMTLGFVSAGFLTFPQSIGVLYGANIGTTVTGWMVNMLGFKLQLGTLALPVLFVSSLVSVLGRGQLARVGRLAAGLAMLFIGLDMMQAGLRGAEGLVTPQTLPGDTVSGRAQLVAIGFAVTVLLQSSSAGVAMALVLLGSGAISFAQAAAMVIGMNLGTTITALLASLGGSLAMRQTAVANLMFNAGTAVIAFPLLDLVTPLLHGTVLGADDQTALVLFHTGFNLLGAALFLPFTAGFVALVIRIVPAGKTGPPVPLAEGLDRALLSDPSAALDAAQKVSGDMAAALFVALGDALRPAPDLRGLSALPGRIAPTQDALEHFLARVRIPEDRQAIARRYSALLHQADHIGRLADRATMKAPLAVIPEDPDLRRPALALGLALRRAGDAGPEASAGHFARLSRLLDARARRFRREALLRDSAEPPGLDPFARTDAMRWLHRVAGHAERIAHYGMVARLDSVAPAPAARKE